MCLHLFSASLPISSSPLFCPLSSIAVLFSACESCRLLSGRTTCLPVHQTHSRQASGLDSKLKTHYRAISPGIMLSNDLISLSVSPVSHQRPRQLGRPCPRVPGALSCSRHRHCRRHCCRCHASHLSLSSSKTGYKPQSLEICQGKVTGDTGGKRLWNESAGYFIYHIHSIRQSGAVNQGPRFDSKGGGVRTRSARGEKWDTAKKWLMVTVRPIPAQPKSV